MDSIAFAIGYLLSIGIMIIFPCWLVGIVIRRRVGINGCTAWAGFLILGQVTLYYQGEVSLAHLIVSFAASAVTIYLRERMAPPVSAPQRNLKRHADDRHWKGIDLPDEDLTRRLP